MSAAGLRWPLRRRFNSKKEGSSKLLLAPVFVGLEIFIYLDYTVLARGRRGIGEIKVLGMGGRYLPKSIAIAGFEVTVNLERRSKVCI